MQPDDDISSDAFATKINFKKKPKGGSIFCGKFDIQTDDRRPLNSGSDRIDKRQIHCFKCKHTGHYRSDCPTLKPPKNSGNVFNVGAVLSGGREVFSKHDFYLDSGASIHLTAKKDWLTDISKPNGLTDVYIANETKLPVECKGNLQVLARVDNKIETIVVKDVYYVPKLATNLLSVGQLLKNQNKVIFARDTCKILNQSGQLVAVATEVNNMFKLDLEVDQSNKCLMTSLIWHRRLGHLSDKTLIKMTGGAVNGIKGSFQNQPIGTTCRICKEGKQTRLPFVNQGQSRTSNVLEMVHADVCGPMETTSLGGARYFLIMLDDYSKMAFVYLLKTKDQVSAKIKEFHRLVENQTGKRIKALRSDNGGEFCSDSFDHYLRQNGILHQRTTPHCPEQNGSAERLNRTIVEKARCLLFDANLDKRFWAEAVNTAVYLYNRTSIAGLMYKSPFEKWFGHKPDISHLRIFGSKTMVHIPKANRLKWDKKAKEMILVGYSEVSKGYRLYDPETKNVVVRRDVAVMENGSSTEISQLQLKILP